MVRRDDDPANRAGIDVKKDLPEIEQLCARIDVHKLAMSLERQLGTPEPKDSTIERASN